jgi:Tol biopolymer transport system component
MMIRKGIAITLFASLMLTCLCRRESQSETQKTGEFSMKPLTGFKGRIVFQSNFDGDNEIYLLTENNLIPLTDNDWDDGYPVWSPDGTQIAFHANPGGNYDIFVMNDDGSGISAVASSPEDESDPSWFPGGKILCYTKETKKLIRSRADLYKVDIRTKKSERLIPGYDKTNAISNVSPADPLVTFTGKRMIGWDVAVYDWDKKTVTFLEDQGDSCRARFSKDGKTLAYVSSTADGKGDIWLMNPDGTQKMRITERNETYDYFPSWSPDGAYIVFNSSRQHDHNGDWQLYIINVETLETTLLFDSPGNDVFADWH